MRFLEELNERKFKSNHDDPLQSIVAECHDLATEMENVLKNLEEKGRGTWKLFEGLQKTGYIIYKRKDLQRLSEPVFKLRSEVSAHLIVLIE